MDFTGSRMWYFVRHSQTHWHEFYQIQDLVFWSGSVKHTGMNFTGSGIRYLGNAQSDKLAWISPDPGSGICWGSVKNTGMYVGRSRIWYCIKAQSNTLAWISPDPGSGIWVMRSQTHCHAFHQIQDLIFCSGSVKHIGMNFTGSRIRYLGNAQSDTLAWISPDPGSGMC